MLLRVLKWTLVGVVGLIAVLAIAAFVVFHSQDGTVRVIQTMVYMQKGGKPNAFEPIAEPRDIVRADGLRVQTEIKYGSKYPNSFLDVWRQTASPESTLPVVLYMHGGGWFMGSKSWGDPLGGGGSDGVLDGTVATIAKQGFAVVNLDYALSPDYRYPTPLLQLNEAITFLRTHSETYGLDMSRLIIMGSSAGAQISAQFGVVVSDPAYAAELGIAPAIERPDVKGLVLFSAPLKASGYNNWRMDAMLWAYLGTQDLTNSKQSTEVDIVSHVTADYPPTYITDGNAEDTFPDDAKAMDRALAGHNVDHVFNYYEPNVAVLGHDYTGDLSTSFGQENLERAIVFMKTRSQ